MFSLGSFFFVRLIFNLFNLPKQKINFDLLLSKFKFSIILGIFLLIIIYLFFKDKNLFLFYEHALNSKSSLSVEIVNNKLTLTFMFLLLLAGPMTVIPLFLYVRGVELCGLGPTGMIFYITPTFQFILGFFYYNEAFSITKLVSFILIWIAVIIYLKDLYEND